ncbi:hypothetical protein SAMN04488040_1970 [Sulfitobacter marinus]|uniref:Translocase n=1 Tax=Sulfitobacter marinus TaxID=394264 RepID=A0A1I6T133_9RHOB|nr:hypothetical protein [Sulfitobacter marinus]SFS82707.1 hypothetical protein SAMN04488040_1970 [Sulfitobacter marinus]
MSRTKEILTAAGTLGCALGIGFIMQSSDVAMERYGTASKADARERQLEALDAKTTILEVQDIELTSAAFDVQAGLTGDTLADPDTIVTLAAASKGESPALEIVPQATPDSCDIIAEARPMAAAMVNVTLDAPCLPNERINIHHKGMIFTHTTSSTGGLDIQVPALSETAVFVLAFGNGDGAVAQTEVIDLVDFRRVVLQWRDVAGFQIHAFEMGAGYDDAGHIWAGNPRDRASAITGEGGFVILNGDKNAASPMLAEVYTFPADHGHGSGGVALSVEAEVTTANCGEEIEAQTLEMMPDDGVRIRDLTLSVPDCDAVGSFLVLNNLLEDLKLASN